MATRRESLMWRTFRERVSYERKSPSTRSNPLNEYVIPAKIIKMLNHAPVSQQSPTTKDKYLPNQMLL